MLTDRRRDQRFNVNLPILYKKKEYFILDKTGEGIVKDISSGGVLVFTREDIPLLTSLKLVIRLKNYEREIKTVAKVVKSGPSWSGYKLSLKFTKINKEDKKILSKDYLVKHPSKIFDHVR